MNLDDLKKHLRAVTPFEWCGQAIFLRKIGAHDGIQMLETIKVLASERLDEHRDRSETIAYYAFAVSKSLASESGELELDSDEGRSLIGQMHFSELCELGDLVLRHSNFAASAEKKTSPPVNCLDSGSASPSDSPADAHSTLA